MARVDTVRAGGGGEPYPEGQTVEPTCDEYGRQVMAGGVGGGGGTVNQGAPNAAPENAWLTYDVNLPLVIGTAAPGATDKGFNVRVIGAQQMAVGAGVAAPGTAAQSVYLIQAGDGEPVLDDEDIERQGIVLVKPIGPKEAAQAVPVVLASDHGSLPLPSGAATESTLESIRDTLELVQVATAQIPASPSQDRTTAAAPSAAALSLGGAFVSGSNRLPVDIGAPSVSVSNFPSTQAVTGTFWPATQPVSGNVTETNSAAIAVSAASLDTKTSPRVGTTLTITRGAATTTSLSLASGAYPDGFYLVNLDASKTIWYRQGTVSTATGAPVFPESEEYIPLADPSTIQVIVSSGTAEYVVKAVA